MRFVLTRSASVDLDQIWDYLAENEGVELADRVAEKIFEGIRRVARFPGIGHRRSDLTDSDVGFWRVFSYLIVFTPDSEPLEVVRILHGAREVEELL